MPTTIHIPRAASPFGSRVPIGLNGRVSYIPTGEDYVASDAEVAALQALNIQTQQFLTTVPDGFILLSQRTYGSRVPVTINGSLTFLPTGVPFQPDASQLAALIAAGRTYRSGGSAPVFTLLPTIVGSPQVGVAMVFSDGVPPLGYLATKRELVDATTGTVLASADAPTALAYTPVSGDANRSVLFRLTVSLLGLTLTVSSDAKSIAAFSGRRTNATVSYGYGRLTRQGFGAVSLSSPYLGLVRPGADLPTSYVVGAANVGTATHWSVASQVNTPTRTSGGAGLPDASYSFPITANFADGTSEAVTLTITPMADVYTVGTTDNLATVGVTDTAIISGKTVEFAAGCDFHSIAVAGGRKFFQSWRPALMTTVRPHDLARMGLPPSWVVQSVQNVTFRNMYVCGDLNPVGISACYAFTRAFSDTNNNSNVIFDGHGVVYDKKWYGSPDAGAASPSVANLRTSGAALPVGTTVIPVLAGTTTNFRAKGVVVGDPITFDGDTTVYRVTADNITYSGTFDDPFVSGGSFTIDQGLVVAINASAIIRAIPAANCYSPEWCDDVTMLNGTFENVQGGVTAGTNTNLAFKIKNWKVRHYWNNIVITGTNPPQGIYMEDCSWVSPDRVSKFVHIDAIQVNIYSQNPLLGVKHCEIYQADGTGFFQGLFMRGDGTVGPGANAPPMATDGSDSGTFDVDGFIATTGAVALISMTGSKNSKFKRVMGVPAVGRVVDAPAAWRDIPYANAMSATLSKTTGGVEYWFGVSTADRIVLFADYNTNLTAGKLVSTNIKAHGNRLFSLAEAPAGSANFGKVKTSEYVSGGYYDADPVAAIAAVDWSTMTHDQVVAGHRAILKPKLNGAYKLADGSYLTALNPDGSWATDAAYVPA